MREREKEEERDRKEKKPRQEREKAGTGRGRKKELDGGCWRTHGIYYTPLQHPPYVKPLAGEPPDPKAPHPAVTYPRQPEWQAGPPSCGIFKTSGTLDSRDANSAGNSRDRKPPSQGPTPPKLRTPWSLTHVDAHMDIDTHMGTPPGENLLTKCSPRTMRHPISFLYSTVT